MFVKHNKIFANKVEGKGSFFIWRKKKKNFLTWAHLICNTNNNWLAY